MPKVKCQERIYCFLNDSISCVNCIHNLNPEQIQRGRRIKDFCNVHKEKLANPNSPEFTLFNMGGKESNEYELHCKGLACKYYLPDLIDIGFVLNEGEYTPNEVEIEVSDIHAEGLSQVYTEYEKEQPSKE